MKFQWCFKREMQKPYAQNFSYILYLTMLLFKFLSEKGFKVQDPSSKSCIACLTCHLELEIADNISNSTFKRSTFAISYHLLQHRGQEKEFLPLRWALFYHRKCCCSSWLYRFKGLIVGLTTRVRLINRVLIATLRLFHRYSGEKVEI